MQLSTMNTKSYAALAWHLVKWHPHECPKFAHMWDMLYTVTFTCFFYDLQTGDLQT